IWKSYSWRRYCEEVRDLALGLAAAGFGAGDKLSVIGENRPRLYFAQLAAISLGGIAVPVYQDAIATELAYVLDHAEISVVVAEDQEQVDKILSLKDRLPHLKLVVYDDPRDLRELGPTMALAPPRLWENALTEIMVRAADATRLKRCTFDYFRGVAERAQACITEGRPVPLAARLLRGIGEIFVYGPLRDQL